MTIDIPKYHTTPFDEISRQSVGDLEIGARQKMIRNLLYPYNRFLDVQETISQWHRPVGDAGDAEVGELGLLLGASGNGKSYMLKSFYQAALRPPADNRMRFPVVYVEVHKGWKAGAFARALLKATQRVIAAKRKNTDDLENCAVERLIEYETVFIIIDDAHFLFENKRYFDENVSLLKAILDANFANVLLSGLDHLEMAVKSDLQIARRAGFIKKLPTFDPKREGRLYQAFLQGVDERMPFAKESALATPAMVEMLFMTSGGSVGFTMIVLKRAARLALTAGAACIMQHHIKLAIEQVLVADKEALLLEEV